LHLRRVVFVCIAVLWLQAGLRASDQHRVRFLGKPCRRTGVRRLQ
jgi:hypothetical protein